MLLNKKKLADKLIKYWYQPKVSPWLWPLLPLSRLMHLIAIRRFTQYARASRPTSKKIPVIIAGNITVGGTGKTPFVIALIKHLQSRGWQPGIISRGYGAASTLSFPAEVHATSDPSIYGDEPVLLAQETQVPVIISPDRQAAVNRLTQMGQTNIIVSDDGLQHYKLHRDIEIVMVDGVRGLGNGQCLPAGPLREPPSRLKTVHLVVSKGALHTPLTVSVDLMQLVSGDLVNLYTNNRLAPVELLQQHEYIHAVAAIGHTAPFFSGLRQAGFKVIEHSFPDHYAFKLEDFNDIKEYPVVMTAKDAVKCRGFARDNWWYLPVQGVLDHGFWYKLDKILECC